MNRWLIVFAVTFAGCVLTLPADSTISADLACEGARLEMQCRKKPAPKPDASVCARCNGRGVLGDASSIRITCPDCGGTGKKVKSVLVPPATKACPNGVCPAR